MSVTIFSEFESEVRSYCRAFPAVFSRAKGEYLLAEDGRKFLDFFAGAGSLNYGHNDDDMIEAAISYMRQDGVLNGLDLNTSAKAEFIETFRTLVLQPRDLNYKLQFTGPTGANAVEAAMKLARKVTQRPDIACFSGGYHGMSLGALSVTANAVKRASLVVQVPGVVRLPYEGAIEGSVASQLRVLQDMLCRPGFGIDPPAAFLLECVQGEGGVNCASAEWLQGVAALARKLGALLIVDEIQTGCGRTGRFFSFEHACIEPDIICLSKSLGGGGLPFSLNLIKPEIDIWNPGEHNGTFRGNNLAMVMATAALRKYWATPHFAHEVEEKGLAVAACLKNALQAFDGQVRVVGKGLMIGLRFQHAEHAREASRRLFESGLLIEVCGPRNEVLKLMPVLTMDRQAMLAAASRIAACAQALLNRSLESETA
ncbi:aspartate aminotransferase family protein [Chromobacterium violaceum]|uniref:aspartate aminotransferase family protein n=1 Tax=Chromobacterium violaceum TaxID=536 RepID=UPI001CE04EE3|nr:aspartate aminotransferase family protein [Chromobacterium violaceum]